MLSSLFAGLLLVGAAVGSNPAKFCSTVNKIVTAAHQQSAATVFCSSYLHIPASTSTAVTTTTKYLPSCANPNGASKRTAAPEEDFANIEARSKPKPSCFKSYTVSSILSSACSCLSISPTTVGSTSTSTFSTSITFKLKATDGPASGSYAVFLPQTTQGIYPVAFAADLAGGEHFAFDDENPPALYRNFEEIGQAFALENLNDLGPVYFDNLYSTLPDPSIESIQCTPFVPDPVSGICTLHCTTFSFGSPNAADGATLFEICPNGPAGTNEWYLDQTPRAGCTAFTPVVVPLD